MSTCLQKYSNCKITILQSQKENIGSHFLEVRQYLQKYVPDRHLPKLHSLHNFCQIKATTIKNKLTEITICLLTYRRTNANGLEVLFNGENVNICAIKQSFLQIKVSKNVMAENKHIPTCPLPSHKMQQRLKLLKIKHDPRHTEVRTYLLHKLHEREKTTIQEWIEDLKKAHESLDPVEEVDEQFSHIFYDDDVEHRLHQITRKEEISLTAKNILNNFQSFQINSHQFIANLATAGFEKLTSELEKAGVKTTHTIYAGTMSFGVKDGRIHLAQTPGGLNYLPVNISIKQVLIASLTDFIKAILKDHKVI
jgi:hypothetical protein